MTELLTAAQMRAIEEAAIASGEVTGLELMERAGRGVVEAILDWRPELATAPHRAVVLCGPGNNGGDGFVVARLLKQRGWEVEVFLYGDEKMLPPDAAENCRRWRVLGEVRPFSQLAVNPEPCDVRIDALFGTGLRRALPSDLLCADQEASRDEDGSWTGCGVAVDIQSGRCADSGKELGGEHGSLYSELVVTFQSRKIGHFLNQTDRSGREIRCVDLGMGKYVDRYLIDHPDEVAQSVRPWLRRLRKPEAGHQHKYSHGHALILSGGVGKGGAARLAARGALRVGAGLVTLGPPPAAIIENAAQLNAIMLRPVAGADALAEILTDVRFNALCLGPGLGLGAHTLGLVAATLAARRGTVLDADALTSFAEDPAKLFALLHPACVLTPHMGEFARLFPDIAAKLAAPAAKGPAYSKVDAAREAAARAGCVVLLKGPDTVIADPHGRAAINSAHYDRAAPWLATAGSGDVLAGMITGLLARGFPPTAAAETAAWLQVEAARKFGPGLIAEDIPEMIPAIFRDLGL